MVDTLLQVISSYGSSEIFTLNDAQTVARLALAEADRDDAGKA